MVDRSVPPAGQLQFNTRTLLLVTAICGASVALVQNFGLRAAVGLFLVAAAGSWALSLSRADAGTKRFWWEAVWGVLMPLVCLMADPFVFSSGPSTSMGDVFDNNQAPINLFAGACYCFMGWQMLMLGTSWLLRPRHKITTAFVSGSLATGTLFSGAVGILLFPATLMGSLALIGLPGWTPWLTMLVYARAARHCWQSEHPRRPGGHWLIAAAGAVSAIAPAAVWGLTILMRAAAAGGRPV